MNVDICRCEARRNVLSFSNLSLFYKNFSELYSAGIDVASTVESLKTSEKNVERNYSLQLVALNLKNGRSLYQSLKNTQYVPVYDLPIVKAAEDSGRIVDIFNNLAKKHLDTSESVKQIRQSLIKPFFTLAVALMFPGVPDLFSQKITVALYLKNSLGILFLISVAFYLVYSYWTQSFFDIKKARKLHRVLILVPLFSSLSARTAIEKFSSSLAMMLESSIDFFEALRQAGQCSANPNIQSAVNRIVPKIQSGIDLKIAFKAERIFPDELTTAVALGSQSGKLPEFLNRYSSGLRVQNERTVQTTVKFFPIILYWLVVIQIAFSIVTFYRGYLDELLKIAP